MTPRFDPTDLPEGPCEGDGVPDLPPEIAEEIRLACLEAHAAARATGEALAQAKQLVDWDEWDAWLLENCNMTPDEAQRLMDYAAESEPDPAQIPDDLPIVRAPAKVVCGWCAQLRAEQGLQPKHLRGPEDAERVEHGVCAECDESVERLLSRFRRDPPPLLDLPVGDEEDEQGKRRSVEGRPPPTPHAESWALAAGDLRRALFHIDQVSEAVDGLRGLERVGVLNGIGATVEQAAETLDKLTLLAAELVLIAQGEDYLDDVFNAKTDTDGEEEEP